MRLKIKWNDDRVRGATLAIRLIARDRLARGETADLIRASLAEYREDPDTYKANKATWPDAGELGPLANTRHAAQYRKLNLAIDGVLQKIAQGKRQFNSLLELDNHLIASLEDLR